MIKTEGAPAVWLGAMLGLALGVMRHPQWIDVEGKPHDPFRAGKRLDEVGGPAPGTTG